MKVGLITASLVLVAGSATACSNSASTEDFCAAYADFTSSLFDLDSDDPEDFIPALKDAAEEFGDVGVPDDMSGDANAGYELVLDTISELDDDASVEDLGAIEEDFSEEEQKNSDAFQAYLDKNCSDADLGGE